MGQPYWLRRWVQEGSIPVMQFEMVPGETLKEALGFAGGFTFEGFSGSLTLKRASTTGEVLVRDLALSEPLSAIALQQGDIVTALPQRNLAEPVVHVTGWARVLGMFPCVAGQSVGAFLKQHALLLPDTYLERGELVRTKADGTKQFFAFNPSKAMAGDAMHDLKLEVRDAIELYRVGDMKLTRTVEVVGPVPRPGQFDFIEGMRVSDLLFRAGTLKKGANTLVAELIHSRDGKAGEILRLDLSKLVSSEGSSPVELRDDGVNPLLQPFDRLSIFQKPDFHFHRAVTLSGQVNRPGLYELDNDKTTLRDLIARAGGLTDQAMPVGGIFLRSMNQADPDRARTSVLTNLNSVNDPTANGVNEILQRLNETKRSSSPSNSNLEPNPLLHALDTKNTARMVVDMPGLLAGKAGSEIELQDGDEILFPRKTNFAYVVGETASPFAAYQVQAGTKVKDLLRLAGGPTRNADTYNIRLLKADGRIIESWVRSASVEPGDAILVPQRIKKDLNWQENLAALTPLAILINTFK